MYENKFFYIFQISCNWFSYKIQLPVSVQPCRLLNFTSLLSSLTCTKLELICTHLVQVVTVTNNIANFSIIYIINFNENWLWEIIWKKNFLMLYNIQNGLHISWWTELTLESPPVRKSTKKHFYNFSNFLNLILARKYNFLREYSSAVCFSLLWNYHPDVQSLN